MKLIYIYYILLFVIKVYCSGHNHQASSILVYLFQFVKICQRSKFQGKFFH